MRQRSKKKQKDYGYRPEAIVVDKDYVFGGILSPIPKIELQPNGKWVAFLPNAENQSRNGVEPADCVSMTTNNCVEILLRRLYNEDHDYSDRFLAFVSGTQGAGNSPQTVGEFLRKVGAVNEAEWPFGDDVDSYEKFYAPPPPKLYERARVFNDTYDFKHEYVPTSPELLKQALKLSPIGVAVPAWFIRDGLYYRPQGKEDNHFTTLIDYDDGVSWTVFDSYESNIKKLEWGIGFSVAKRYYVSKKVVVQPKSWIDKFLELWIY